MQLQTKYCVDNDNVNFKIIIILNNACDLCVERSCDVVCDSKVSTQGK